MKINVYVKKELYLKLKVIAELLNIPVSCLVRQCIEEEERNFAELFNMVVNNNVKKS